MLAQQVNQIRPWGCGSIRGALWAGFFLAAAVSTTAEGQMTNQDQQRAAIDQLQRELTTQRGFVQVHAAEALLAAGVEEPVRRQIAAELPTAQLPLSIGLWRVLARVATDDAQRQAYVQRIRQVALDPASQYRVHAIESLAKLSAYQTEDRQALERFIAQADEASAAFACWLLSLSNQPQDLARLARLPASEAPLARLRAGYIVSRSAQVERRTVEAVLAAVDKEPQDSPARIYLLSAALRHGGPEHRAGWLAAARQYLTSDKPNEALEAGFALSIQGDASQLPRLVEQLQSTEADARIGAADGILRILRQQTPPK